MYESSSNKSFGGRLTGISRRSISEYSPVGDCDKQTEFRRDPVHKLELLRMYNQDVGVRGKFGLPINKIMGSHALPKNSTENLLDCQHILLALRTLVLQCLIPHKAV